jgi:alkanesulfonate monooxygenase SsuD/methylene tetrahydromethanopterin reductase-like flavin-dependent oxidoreductase (luciferase family)
MALSGIGDRPYVGTPDKVAEDMATLARARLRGHRVLVRQLRQRRAVLLCRGLTNPRS